MTNLEKIESYFMQNPGEMISDEHLADVLAIPIDLVKLACKGLRSNFDIHFVSQTVEGETPCQGYFNGGDPFERILWYTYNERKRGGARPGAGRKANNRELEKVTIRLFKDQMPISDSKIREAVDIYLSSCHG
jgi:hypothetical protein